MWSPLRRRIAEVIVAGTLVAVPVAAQEIPADMLKLDHQRCQRDCMESLDNEAVCKQLCDCTIDQFKKKLTFKEYLKISGELAQQKTSSASRKVLDEVANYCAARIQWPDEEAAAPATRTDSEQSQ